LVPAAFAKIADVTEAPSRLPVAAALESVRSVYNVGAFFRSGDAAGIERLHLCGYTGRPPHKGIAKTALGAEETLPWEHCTDLPGLIAGYRAKGWQTAAVETTLQAIDVFDWTPRFPVLLLFGNEVDGLSAPVLEEADVHVRIPMLGVKESLNVAVAGGVLLFEMLRKFRETAKNRGSLEFAAQVGGRR
jgi:tRNA G18 (ribose-2'-O)-methylase SpoU